MNEPTQAEKNLCYAKAIAELQNERNELATKLKQVEAKSKLMLKAYRSGRAEKALDKLLVNAIEFYNDLIGQPRVDDIRNKTIPSEAFIAAGLRLKACPFCGSEISDTGCTHTPETGDLHYVWCHKCRTQSAHYQNRQDAIDAWNTRI